MAIVIPSPIVKPFCNSGFETPPNINTDTVVANQEIGFPPLQATPLDAGGEPYTIDQLNGVFNFYTQQIQALVSGWKFTFNQAVSDQNGGYPLGVILYCASNNSFQRSLVNNNTANFITTPSYIDDGINWTSNTLINLLNINSAVNFYNAAKTQYTSLAANPPATTTTNNYLPLLLPTTANDQYLTCDLSGNWSWTSSREKGIYGSAGSFSSVPYSVTNAPIPPVLQLWTSPIYYNVTGTPYNTGTNIFTAPITGTYRLNLNLGLDSSGTSAPVGQKLTIQTVINNLVNSQYVLGNFSYEGSLVLASGSVTFNLTAGDTFYIGITALNLGICGLNFSSVSANLSWNF